MSRGAAGLVSIPGRESPYWAPFLALYHEAFPPEEREPDALIAERTAVGRYRLRVSLSRDGRVTGCYVVDLVPAEDYALLCYVAVQARFRKSGVGGRLCQDAVDWFRANAPVSWLLVEAKGRAARLYRRCGFARLALDYRVPYVHAPGVQPLQLLVLPAGGESDTVDGEQLRRVIEHLFVDGYLVSAEDRRLRDQLSRVPERVRIEHAPVQATG